MRPVRFVAILAVLALMGCDATPPSPGLSPATPTPSASPSAPPTPGTPAAACDAAVAAELDAESQGFNMSYGPSAGPDGGQMTVGTLWPIAELDPLRVTKPGDLLLSSAVWRGPLRFSSDYKLLRDLARVAPALTNGLVDVLPTGGMTVTWCLARTAWSDGEPVTCSDYAYSLTWLANVEPELAPRFGGVSAVDCPDPLIAILRYPRVFEAYLAHALLPLPRHVLEGLPPDVLRGGRPFDPSSISNLPTSGPYRISKITTDEVILTRNDGYRGGAYNAAAHLESVTLRRFHDPRALAAAVRDGSVQLASGFDVADVDWLESLGLSDSIAAAPSATYDTIMLNLSPDQTGPATGRCSLASSVASRGPACPTADLALRTGIAQALDLDAIAGALAPNEGEQRFGSVVVPQAWFFADVAPLPPGPAGAVAGLQAAGWVPRQRDGIRTKNGVAAVVELCTIDDQAHRSAAAIIRLELLAAGIQVDPRFVPADDLGAAYGDVSRTSPCAVSRSNFDLALTRIASFMEPADFRIRYHSASVEPDGLNDGRVDDPAVDAALDIVVGSVDFSVIKEAMTSFQQRLVDQVIELPIGSRRLVSLVGARLGNYYQIVTTADSWNAEDWYLKPAIPTLHPQPSQLP